ncbi:MAG TPA: choice-of-anchor D domain-containing protein [Dokdonella sp.]|nr:choice-of-anchor D domain-containing protein [Dokdonella sp.]
MFCRFQACALSAATLCVTLLSAGQADASSASAAGRLLHASSHSPAYALASVNGTAEKRQETAAGPKWLTLADLSNPKSSTATPLALAMPVNGDEIKGQGNEPKPSSFSPGGVIYAPQAPLGQGYLGDVEPNGTFATATPIPGTNQVVRGNLFPNGDVDFYSFTAAAGDRVYAAMMTSFSAGSSTDSQMSLFASDGTTLIEFDDDNGSFASLSSSIAGATIPAAGTYYLRINDFTAGTTSERPYELHFRLQSGAPTPEVESNDTPATANVLPANGWVSGTRNPAAATEQDWYSFSLNAGDTVYLSLDTDPERDGVVWNGRLGIALFGDAANQILVVDDAGTGDVSPNPNIPSEALFMTVKTAGTYFAFVDSASAAVGGPTATYTLSVSVHPATNEGVNCTTYTSTDVPKTIGPGTGLVSSVITVPGNPRIADVDVDIVLNHALMGDIDAHLRSPAGNDNGLFTDIGASATGGQAQMNVVFDDEAGIPPSFTVLSGVQYKPELAYRLAWFDGEDAGGTWTLDLRDDTAGANGGTLTSWSLRICEAPPPPTCPPGTASTTVYSTDFESGAAGFTHGGTADEWELGLPASAATTTANPLAAFTTCNSGTNCWKTDLDNTYNVSSSQDLLSPNIDLSGLVAPIVVNWAQRYQMESANFDHLFVDFQQAGGATPVRLFEFLDATMTNAAGNPATNIGASAGWAQMSRRADSLAGLNSELRFHVDSDTTVNFQGLAIDDVSVTGCRALSADLAITKTDGVTSAVPGGSVTYTITGSNAGPDAVTGATIADTFPASETCTWTCVGAGGGTCTAAGSGNINDAVNLPSGGSVTYTASCAISAAASGTLTNTATINSAIADPNPVNNSATDSDVLTPQADLAITKTDGVTTAVPGGSVTYTITGSNAGPSNAPGSTIADTFPASETCTWTCVGAGGGTCTAAGSGNISDAVNLPAGASVTYTASCAISAAATGTLSNTATITGSVTDPTPGNNSATDTDTLTPQVDLSITKTDGVASVVAGGSTVYTITASNAGPSLAAASTVADSFPATLTCTWTCAGAGGGTCTAAGSGNINDTVNLPAGGSTTHTANCTVSAAASGSIANTATVAAAAGVTDTNPANNSATDTDSVLLPGALAVSPTSINFGSIAVGSSSAAQTVTLSNTGGSPLQVTAITAATAPFASSGGSCGAVPFALAAGASCTLDYMFSPTASGPASQNLTVTSNAGNGAIALSGTGVVGVIGVLSATIDFGGQLVGTSSQLALTILNTGGGPLQVTAITPAAAPFAEVAGGTCGAVPFALAAGANCTVLYSFTPTAAGMFSQVITITSDVGTATATLSGEGLAGLVDTVELDVLSPWSSLLLLMLLGLTAAMATRRYV